MTIASDVQHLDPAAGPLVDLFVLDTSTIPGHSSVYYFHAGVNALGNDITWQGQAFSRWPIEVDGLELRASGTLPRPTLRVANITGVLTSINKATGDMVGARITRKRTFVKYLDAVNFPGGINANADPTAHFVDQIYYVDRKADSNNVYVQYELAAAMDLQAFQLPARQIIQNVCTWTYRSAECGYAGGAVADANDVPTAIIGNDSCGKRLTSCKLRFGANAQLPYGGFPGAGILA